MTSVYETAPRAIASQLLPFVFPVGRRFTEHFVDWGNISVIKLSYVERERTMCVLSLTFNVAANFEVTLRNESLRYDYSVLAFSKAECLVSILQTKEISYFFILLFLVLLSLLLLSLFIILLSSWPIILTLTFIASKINKKEKK